MSTLCIGSVFKVLSLATVTRNMNSRLEDALFPSDMRYKTTSSIYSHIKDCTKNLPPEFIECIEYLCINDMDQLKDKLFEIIKATRSLLNPNKLKLVTSAIQDIISNDPSLDCDTIIGYDSRFTASIIPTLTHVNFDELLSNVLYYTYHVNNTGHPDIKDINSTFMDSLETLSENLTLTSSTEFNPISTIPDQKGFSPESILEKSRERLPKFLELFNISYQDEKPWEDDLLFQKEWFPTVEEK